MSYVSDDAALSSLCALIFKRDLSVTVLSEGDRLCVPSRDYLTVREAVCSVSDDVMLLMVGVSGRRVGWFRVLLQDDPDCLIVDYGVNAVTEVIWRHWSVDGGVV